MDKYFIVFNSEEAKYVQIVNHIIALINKEKIIQKEKLPSIRNYSAILKVNKDTIVTAYNKLCEYGYAFQKVGSGTYVKKGNTNNEFKKSYRDIVKTLNNDDSAYIDFVGDSIQSSFFPIKDFKDVLNDVIDRDGADAFLYKDSNGFENLRKTIIEILWDNKYDYNDLLIISGAQQGIDLVSRAIINLRDSVVVEKPTYNGALNVFNWRKADIIDIPIYKGGIDVEAFEKILMKNSIKCFYTMGSFQNPTGLSYSLKNKKRIIELAKIYNFYILEDDYISELNYNNNYENSTFKSLDKYDKVIYLKSFSKTFLPGIRLGYILVPKELKETILHYKINTDITTSSIMQRALDLYIRHGSWKTHIDKLKKGYSKRYDIITDILRKSLLEELEFIEPKGGLSIYLKLKGDIDSIELFKRCLEKGLVITPGVFFYKDYKEGLRYFKIGFAKASDEDILKGMEILKTVLEGNEI